jgi:hypothetical protein
VGRDHGAGWGGIGGGGGRVGWGFLTLLLAAVVVAAVLVTAGSRLNQSRLGGRNVRIHRRALGRLATITSEQPDRVVADVSQAHLHVRLVDEDSPPGAEADETSQNEVVDLREPPDPEIEPFDLATDQPAGALVVAEPDAHAEPVAGVPRIPATSLTGSSLRGLEDRMAALRETDIEVSALPTGAVAALTRLGPADVRSRRQRRQADKVARRR